MMNNPEDASLPRLLYLGDVPVESSYHGSALLHRLLETYPADRLQVIEAGWHASLAERRLKNVPYHFRPLPLNRLYYSRLTRWIVTGHLLMAAPRGRRIEALAESFKPEAVLTVAHGISWITAAALARKLNIPLHLICHDEWVDSLPSLPITKNWRERVFREIYQSAASRLCVSPFMIENFAQRYGVGGKLLYPSRAAKVTTAKIPAQRLSHRDGGLVVGYAGSVYSSEALRMLAECLKPLGGTLVIFAPGTRGKGAFADLDLPNIRFQGLLGSQELIVRLREEVDVLFVPMSFLPSDRPNTETCFPSKLTDYTAAGLPLLIHSPEYGSAARWARENPGVAEVVTNPDAPALTEALQRLRAHPEYLISLARRAIEVGEQFFSHAKAWEVFHKTMVSGEVDSVNSNAVNVCRDSVK